MFVQIVDWSIQHWPEIFAFDFLRYAIPASLLTAALALLTHRLAHRRIQARKATTSDRSRELRYSLSTIFIFSLVGLCIAAGEQLGWMRIESGMTNPLWLIGSFALILVAHDAYFYWSHRLMHHKRVFRLVHRTHHLSRTPTPWTAYSFSPLEALVEAAFLPLYLLLVPTHVIVIGIFLIHMILRNVIAHAGFELFPRRWMSWPLARWITVSLHHDQHHEHFHCNYGFYFTWWDRWMGTEHPEYRSKFAQLTQNAGAGAVTKVRASSRAHLNVLLVCGSVLMFGAAGNVEAKDPCGLGGLWVTEGFGAVVEIRVSADQKDLQGIPTWIFDSNEQHLLGVDLFSDFTNAQCRWSGGRILNPENGRRYRSTIAQQEGGSLAVKGCIGPFCVEQTWRRYDAVLAGLPGVGLPDDARPAQYRCANRD